MKTINNNITKLQKFDKYMMKIKVRTIFWIFVGSYAALAVLLTLILTK